MPARRPLVNLPAHATAASLSAPHVQLEYAWSPARQRLVHIGEVQPGETYQHPDPTLRLPLIPRKGFLRRHHFAHHPSATAALIAAGVARGGEGWRHLNVKLALVHRLQNGGDLLLRQRCPVCARIEKMPLRSAVEFDTATWEVPFGDFRLDVGLLKSGKTVGALEVFDTHAVDAAKQHALTAAGRASGFQAFEIPVAPLPLRPPLEIHAAHPRKLCSACLTRRQEWLTWSRANRPATNFSGWIERPASLQSCVALGGGWATRTAARSRGSSDGNPNAAAGSDALTPVFYWFELRVVGERDLFVTALTLHRRQGCLRFRELRLRLPTGRPTVELEFQLTHAANEFAAAAQHFRQRLARADAAQLETWLTQAAHIAPQGALPASAQASAALAAPAKSAATASAGHSRPGAAAAAAPIRPTPAAAAAPKANAPNPPSVPPPPLPLPKRQRLAQWIDRLAHQAADWLEQSE